MRKSKFTDEQIAYALHQAEVGTAPPEICRKLGISEQTFYRWKKKYGGLGVSELRELKQLREENRRLKRMVADLSLDKQMLREVVERKPEAGSETRMGRISESRLSSQRAPSLHAASVWAFQPSLPQPTGSPVVSSDAIEGSRQVACLLRLPTAAHHASARGLADQSQTDL